MSLRTHHALPATPFGTLDDAVADGVGEGWATARNAEDDAVVAELDRAGIRGRGGAGFPTARKWASVRAQREELDDVDIVVNAAEGEPGTFKDRALLRANPALVIEGAIIAARCLGSRRIVVATKARYHRELERLERTIAEIAAAGWADDVEIAIVAGPDHYLFGEESALLEVVEGNDPLPRQIPPYLYGLFSTAPQLGWSANAGPVVSGSNPSLVNNVETLAHVALVMRHGAAWYRSMGTEQSPGPTIVTITGDVERPAVAEVALGHPLGEVVDEIGGGLGAGRQPRAILSGVSNPVLTADAWTTPVTYEDLAAAGGGLGSAGFVVYDDRRNLIDVAYQVSRFLHVESCGQCQPCKGGTGEISIALEQLVLDGAISERAERSLRRSLQTVTDGSRCFLASQEQRLITSILQRFPEDLERRIAGEVGDPHVVLPKLVDLVDGEATVDDAHARKRPDWTYGEVPVRLGPRAVPPDA